MFHVLLKNKRKETCLLQQSLYMTRKDTLYRVIDIHYYTILLRTGEDPRVTYEHKKSDVF